MSSEPRPRWGGADVRGGLLAVAALVGAMWVVEIVNAIDGQGLDRGGIEPRDVSHLYGVVFAPFLHSGFAHLEANTLPFLVLGCAIAFSGARRLLIVTAIVVFVSGIGVWLVAPAGTVTIGASGVVFGYAAYLISRGLFDRRAGEIAVGVLVALMFGGALLTDLLPRAGISWQGHLFGALGGVIAAFALSRPGSRHLAGASARGRRAPPS